MSDQLPPGWAIAPLEALLVPLEDGRLLHHGWSPQCEKTPAGSEQEWGVLKTTAIQAGQFLSEHNKKLPAHLKARPQNEVKVGDLLITCAGPRVRCGIPCLVRHTRPKLMLSGKMYRFRVSKENFEASYLEKYLLSHSAQMAIDRMKTGGNESGLNLTHDRFKPLPVPIAPVNEQRRIASKIDELFGRIEDGERALERVRKLVERYRQSVLKAAVTGELTRAWREQRNGKMESGKALLERILKFRRAAWEKAELDKMKAKGQKPTNDHWKQRYQEPSLPDTTDLPELPEGWVWASLNQLSWASSYGTSEKCGYGNPGIAVLRIPNIRGGRFEFDDIKNAASKRELEVAESVRKGDLLVIRTNGSDRIIGAGAVSLEDPPFPCYFASYLIRFRLALDDELSHWVNLCWQSHVVRRFVDMHKATSAGQYNISQSKLLSLCLPIPPAAERIFIEDEVDAIFSKSSNAATSVQSQAQSALALRQTVLKSAFSGRLVRQDATDEPAAVLLKRIAIERDSGNSSPKHGRKNKTPA